ncbi:hypothetical protein [Devosia submarina]|uniref:hypothetical protein n=1 Tax=Devosia submarina TaxID=1173082 RepID=UPI000D36BD97|nr:hypothetical protein [Devosia submarina]
MRLDYAKIWASDFYSEILLRLDQLENGYNDKIVLNITFKFKISRSIEQFGTLDGTIERLRKYFELFYNMVCAKLLGKNYHRKDRSSYPIVWTFLEPGGHKFAREIGEIIDLHFHTVWFIDRNQEALVQDVRNKFISGKRVCISDIFIQNVNFGENRTKDLYRVFKYNLKFQNILKSDAEIPDSIWRYPKH